MVTVLGIIITGIIISRGRCEGQINDWTGSDKAYHLKALAIVTLDPNGNTFPC